MVVLLLIKLVWQARPSLLPHVKENKIDSQILKSVQQYDLDSFQHIYHGSWFQHDWCIQINSFMLLKHLTLCLHLVTLSHYSTTMLIEYHVLHINNTCLITFLQLNWSTTADGSPFHVGKRRVLPLLLILTMAIIIIIIVKIYDIIPVLILYSYAFITHPLCDGAQN